MHSPPAAISYETEIDVPGDPALADQMKQISQLVARQGEADSELALQRRAAADITRLEAAARAAGYYDAKLSYEIDKRREPWRVTVKVALGAPYRLREVKVILPGGGVPPLAERFDPADLGLELGMRAQSAPILAAEDKLLRYYTTRGYPLAKVTGHQAIIDRADRSMHVTFTVVPGPAASFGKTEISGLTSVNRDFIEKRLAWKEGERYDSRKVDSTQQTLIASNLFATVRIAPADKVSPDGRIPMRISVTERRPRSVGGGLYYDFKPGLRRQGLLGASQSLRRGRAAAYRGHGRPERLRTAGAVQAPGLPGAGPRSSQRSLDRPADDRCLQHPAGEVLHRARLPDSTARSPAAIGAEVLNGRVDDDTGTQNYTLAGLPAYIRRDDTDDLLNPTRGTRLGFTATPFFAPRRQQPGLLSGQAQRQRLSEPGPDHRFILAGFTNIGSITGTSLDSLPRDLRLYEGGGGSVRGYGFQRAGPLDVFGNPIGGISSLDLGVELRTRINDTFGLVTFFEGGSVYDTTLPDLSQRLYLGNGRGAALLQPDRTAALRYRHAVGPASQRRHHPGLYQPGTGLLEMKRLGRILLYSLLGLVLVVLLAVAGGYGFLQTASGKAWLAATLAQALSTPGEQGRHRRACRQRRPSSSASPPFALPTARGPGSRFDDVTLSIDGAALLRGELAIRQLRAASARGDAPAGCRAHGARPPRPAWIWRRRGCPSMSSSMIWGSKA